jgi:hypothetical protein
MTPEHRLAQIIGTIHAIKIAALVAAIGPVSFRLAVDGMAFVQADRPSRSA